MRLQAVVTFDPPIPCTREGQYSGRVAATILCASERAYRVHPDDPEFLPVAADDHEGHLTVRWLSRSAIDAYGPLVAQAWADVGGEAADQVTHEIV